MPTIEIGIQPSCSETVYRIPAEYKHLADVVVGLNNSDPTEGYSQMRPTKDTVCYYFYQSDNRKLCDMLEEFEIPYDIQSPFGNEDEHWIPIKLSEIEKLEKSDGGSGQFYTRMPYGN